MAVVLLANLGTRDVRFRSEPLTPRPDGASLLELLDEPGGAEEVAAHISLAILMPAISYIKDHHGRLDCLILFVTDQSESVGEEHRRNDTIFLGKLIKELLEKDLVGVGEPIPVRLEVIQSGVQNYVMMYDWFKERVPGILKDVQRQFGGIDRVYVQLAGGIPACKTNLALALLREPYRVHTLYVNERTQQVDPGDFGRVLRGEQLIDLLEEYLGRDDYAAAVSLAERWSPEAIALLSLLRALHYRQLFRFDEALKCFRDARTHVPSEPLTELIRNTKSVAQGVKLIEEGQHNEVPEPVRDLLADFWYHTQSTYRNERYVDFVGRFWRLREALLRLRAERYEGLIVGEDRRNQVTYYNICLQHEGRTPFTSWCEQGMALQRARNRLYVGHAFGGASESEIQGLWPGEDILGDTSRMLAAEFGIRYPTTYKTAHDVILQLANNLWQDE